MSRWPFRWLGSRAAAARDEAQIEDLQQRWEALPGLDTGDRAAMRDRLVAQASQRHGPGDGAEPSADAARSSDVRRDVRPQGHAGRRTAHTLRWPAALLFGGLLILTALQWAGRDRPSTDRQPGPVPPWLSGPSRAGEPRSRADATSRGPGSAPPGVSTDSIQAPTPNPGAPDRMMDPTSRDPSATRTGESADGPGSIDALDTDRQLSTPRTATRSRPDPDSDRLPSPTAPQGAAIPRPDDARDAPATTTASSPSRPRPLSPDGRDGFVAGRVLDPAGTGIADAVVTAWRIDAPGIFVQRSEADGRYRLELPPGRYHLHAEARDRAERWYDGAEGGPDRGGAIELRLRESGRTGIDFVLPAGPSEGASLPGARVDDRSTVGRLDIAGGLPRRIEG